MPSAFREMRLLQAERSSHRVPTVALAQYGFNEIAAPAVQLNHVL